MKWLIFGDVHGNLPALELLLQKEKGNYDSLICHGDIVNYGPWSDGCVALLNELDAVCLKGNHEEYFIKGEYFGSHPVAKAFFDFCYPRYRQYGLIQQYFPSFEIEDYTVQHTVLDKYIFLDTDISPDELTGNYIIGHSHQQYKRITGNFALINTGSLGQNRAFINVADYILYDTGKKNIALKHFIYDIDVMINEMQVTGYSELCLNYYRNKKRA